MIRLWDRGIERAKWRAHRPCHHLTRIFKTWITLTWWWVSKRCYQLQLMLISTYIRRSRGLCWRQGIRRWSASRQCAENTTSSRTLTRRMSTMSWRRRRNTQRSSFKGTGVEWRLNVSTIAQDKAWAEKITSTRRPRPIWSAWWTTRKNSEWSVSISNKHTRTTSTWKSQKTVEISFKNKSQISSNWCLKTRWSSFLEKPYLINIYPSQTVSITTMVKMNRTVEMAMINSSIHWLWANS